jgi:chemotaxis protein methyltransferase CheR
MNADLTDELYTHFRDLLLARCGLYYPERKRGDLAHGLSLALETTSHRTLAELYSDAVDGGPGWEAILAQLTIGETYFFRNGAQFDALREHILPELLDRRGALRTLRLWSAGCATGEEPYSLAILLNELLSSDHPWNTSILATDINPVFLARAREALYGNWSFRETPDELRTRYWTEEQGRWRLRPDIRRMVSFARLNLAEPCFPAITNGTSAMDIIVCRNVTIYFDEATTRQIAERFYSALTPGGWLIVGHAEPQASVYHQFEVHNFPNTVVYRKPLDAPLFAFDPASGVFSAGARPILKPRPPTGPLSPLRTAEPFAAAVHERAEGQGRRRGQTAPLTSLQAANQWPATPSKSKIEQRGRNNEERGSGPRPLGLSSVELQPSVVSDPRSSAPDLWPAITSLLAQGEKSNAEELLKELLRANPSHAPALTTLGRLYADRAEWVSARQQCLLALEQDALCIPGHYLLAQIHEHQGQLDAALAAYRRALYLDRGFVPAMLGMANVWRRMGRVADAQRYYRNALKTLSELPPTTPIPDVDGATAEELAALIARQLDDIAGDSAP